MDDKLNLLRRFFSNKYSRNDYLELKKLLLFQSAEFEVLMDVHWGEFKSQNLNSRKDLSEMLADINREMNKGTRYFFYKKFIHNFSRIAAVLILPLFLALGFLFFQFNEYLFQKNVYVEVISPTGSRTKLNLPDGSAVWLNGDSYIRYPAVFNKNREVEIDGEAFFKVNSDKEHPFFVLAKDICVKATGTEFNVSAYDDDPEINVILKEGKVSVLDANQSKLKEMKAGYQFMYHKNTSSVHYTEFYVEDYAGWIDGKLIFRNAPMYEVIGRMKRWYGVDIEIVDKELRQLHFKATFIDESIEEALKLLQSTATFEYHFAKRKPREDGSFETPKIYITAKK